MFAGNYNIGCKLDALFIKKDAIISIEFKNYGGKVVANENGGMDFIMDYRLVYCLQHGLPLDQDVYDAAEWSCIGALTAASLEHNNAPVAVPDFTRGDWAKIDGYRHAMAQ